MLCWLLATFACASYLLSTAFRSSFLFPAGFDPTVSRFRKGAQERGMSGMYLKNLMLTIRTKESKEMMSRHYYTKLYIQTMFISYLYHLTYYPYPNIQESAECVLWDAVPWWWRPWTPEADWKKCDSKWVHSKKWQINMFFSVIHKWQICHCSAEVSSVCSFRMIYFVFFESQCTMGEVKSSLMFLTNTNQVKSRSGSVVFDQTLRRV